MLTVTPIYAGLVALVYLALSVNVIRTRRALGIGFGTGEQKLLERRIRAHGNCAEYAPFGIVLLALAEAAGLAALAVHLLGIALLAGRLLHGWALSSLAPRPPARVGGMILTLSMLGAAAILCLTVSLWA